MGQARRNKIAGKRNDDRAMVEAMNEHMEKQFMDRALAETLRKADAKGERRPEVIVVDATTKGAETMPPMIDSDGNRGIPARVNPFTAGDFYKEMARIGDPEGMADKVRFAMSQRPGSVGVLMVTDTNVTVTAYGATAVEHFANKAKDEERVKLHGSLARFWRQRLMDTFPDGQVQVYRDMVQEVVVRRPLDEAARAEILSSPNLVGPAVEITDPKWTDDPEPELLVFADGSGLVMGLIDEQTGGFHVIAIKQVVTTPLQ
jgi:hypothetical protein